MLTRNQRYYAKHKNDPGFMESRRKYQRKRRANDPEYRAYLESTKEKQGKYVALFYANLVQAILHNLLIFKSHLSESNRRPVDYESTALAS